MPSQVGLDDLTTDEREDKSSRGGSKTKTQRSASARSEKDLRDRLNECLERIADSLGERGDEELAEVLHDDAAVMAQGLVSLTRPFVILRTPLLAIVAVVEPVMAFGRVVRVLAGRWRQRRADIAEARAEGEASNVEDTTIQHMQ